MKGAVVFYSFSGNTRKTCVFLKEIVGTLGSRLDLIDLKLEKEVIPFFKQCLEAAMKKKPKLTEANYDLGVYDFIIFASPVWAFTYAPALRSYLKEVKGLENKAGACFLTVGSGAGSKKALKELESVLEKKKMKVFFSKNLSGAKTGDKAYLEWSFKRLLKSSLIDMKS
ncbi:MAG: NAD(P)H-dependent oxidoreductase [Candidatus Omnitrophica bacterium]|nr:NAD(P)H-dependent oxidoreductase [Candidatus Omnitrophota bacterium]